MSLTLSLTAPQGSLAAGLQSSLYAGATSGVFAAAQSFGALHAGPHVVGALAGIAGVAAGTGTIALANAEPKRDSKL